MPVRYPVCLAFQALPLYELEKQDIEDHFTGLLRQKQGGMVRRGIYSSGIAEREFGLIEVRKQSELDKLNLKYGKE